MYNLKNKNLFSGDLLNPNKNQRYYYDFGTGNKIERKEVKEERDAFLEAVNKTSTKPKTQEKDDFLEGFNDPYGEKREQERKQKEQERKEKFANIRANADNRTWSSQSTTSSQTDPFLEGFNQDKNEENKWTGNLFKKKTNNILSPKLPNDDRPTFLSSQFEGGQNPTIQRLNSSPATTTVLKGNVNEKSEYTPIGTYDTNKESAITQCSANSKESFIDKVFSKEVNNNIYTSKSNHYTEKSKGIIGLSKSNYYYAEKDGKRYHANSLETVDCYDWNSIDEDFLNGKFLNLIDEANKKPAHVLRVLTQSIDGELDFKKKLNENTLYLINGVLYNKNEAGNFTWAYFLESHKYSGLFSGALAQAGTLILPFLTGKGEVRLDEEWDRRARWAGVRYYYEKHNKLDLYYFLYGDKIKY